MANDFSHFLFVAKPTANIAIPIINIVKIVRTVTFIPPFLQQAGF